MKKTNMVTLVLAILTLIMSMTTIAFATEVEYDQDGAAEYLRRETDCHAYVNYCVEGEHAYFNFYVEEIDRKFSVEVEKEEKVASEESLQRIAGRIKDAVLEQEQLMFKLKEVLMPSLEEALEYLNNEVEIEVFGMASIEDDKECFYFFTEEISKVFGIEAQYLCPEDSVLQYRLNWIVERINDAI